MGEGLCETCLKVEMLMGDGKRRRETAALLRGLKFVLGGVKKIARTESCGIAI
jgi:hypothetical protein